MTGLLKDTFTAEAEAIGDPTIDLDAIVQTGNRRIKRRRIVATVAAMAASAAVIAGGLTVVHQLSNGQEPQVLGTGPFAERRATWASGNEIHYGSDVLQVKPAISSFVQTNAGFVFTSADGGVYSTAGQSAQPIGKGNKSYLLTADSGSSLVGWVDAGPKTPEFVLYDVAAHREVARTATGNTTGAATGRDPIRIGAIDDGVAYFGASDGLRRWDIAKAVGQLIKPKAKPTFVMAADAGQVVWQNPVPGGDTDVAVGPDVNAPDPKHYEGWDATISPQAKYLLTDKADVTRLVDLRTGTTTTVEISGYVLIMPTQWKSPTTFYAAGFHTEESPLDLLDCTIASSNKVTCKATLKEFAPPLTEKSTTQFPIGLHLPG